VGAFYADETLTYDDTIRLGTQAALYSNLAVSAGHTAPELFNFSAQPSIFQAVALTSFVAFPAVIAAVNATNGGYLIPSTAGQGQSADAWSIDTQSVALFTHNEFSLSDNLVLTLGVRYSQETKELAANLSGANNACASLQAMEAATSAATPTPGGIVSAIQGSAGGATAMSLACNPATNPIANGAWAGDRDENEFSGTASLAYHITEDAMIYGGYSRGYKAGGFNVDRSGFAIRPATISTGDLNVGQLAFEPEFTDAYEIGLRSTLFGVGTFNITGFYQQIGDFQLNAFNGFNFITRNIPEVISQGAEIEFSVRPMTGLTLSGGAVYTDAYFNSTVVYNTLDPVPNTVSAGDPLPFAPEWVGTAAIAYEMPLGGDMRALFYVDGRYNTDYRVQTLNRQAITDNDAFAIFNGRIGVGPQDERWSIEFWGQNLTDEFYHIGGFAPPLQNSRAVFPNQPLTYGITLRARY
jgi:outer membrane receptor protein involved in Fe transport